MVQAALLKKLSEKRREWTVAARWQHIYLLLPGATPLRSINSELHWEINSFPCFYSENFPLQIVSLQLRITK